MDNVQGEFPFLGNVKRPMRMHPASEIALCKIKAHAARLSLLHCSMSQDEIAARLPCSKGQMSHLLSGKRRWTDESQFRFEMITGSLALSQWDARRRGAELYVDHVAQRKAQLVAELQSLEQAA